MQGTSHVRSLIRLFIGAALLCVAWLVLTSERASAAERPAPSKHRSDLARTLPLADRHGLEAVLGDVVGPPSPPARRVAAPVAVLTASVDDLARQVAPVLDQVTTASGPTVDAGLTLVADAPEVAGSLPVAGEPLVRVTDAVVALVHDFPVLGVPSPVVPLPIGDRTPTEVVPVPGRTESVATERDPSMVGADSRTTAFGGRQGLLAGDWFGPPRHQVSERPGTPAAPGGLGEPAGPWAPRDSSPALPSQPSPTGGSAQGSGDPATASASLVLPNPSLFGRSSADWRVPRGLPAHPGTRPD